MQPMSIGLIGCGNISSQYLDKARQFPVLHVAAVADLDLDRARAQAERFGVPKPAPSTSSSPTTPSS